MRNVLSFVHACVAQRPSFVYARVSVSDVERCSISNLVGRGRARGVEGARGAGGRAGEASHERPPRPPPETGAGRSVVEMTYQGGLASRSNPNRDLLVKLNLAGL